MVRTRMLRVVTAVAMALGALVGVNGQAVADPKPAPQTFQQIYPAGVACTFELIVDLVGIPLIPKDTKDKNGNVIRSVIKGKGFALTFTNASTNKKVSFEATHTETRTVFNPDGTRRVTAKATVLILFPTDIPAGPSTTLYEGRIVYDSTATDDFTLLSTKGKSTDICAALS